MEKKVQVALIVGSVRAQRFGPVVGDWCADQLQQRPDIALDRIDVADFPIPIDLESKPVGEEDAVLSGLQARMQAADAFVVVTPEYNHSYPAGLKNFIDWHYEEWQAKPVGFVSYGGIAGGLRAIEHLRNVFAELHAVTIRGTVSFHGGSACFGPDGQPVDSAGCTAAMQALVDQLLWFGRALRDARMRSPYRPR